MWSSPIWLNNPVGEDHIFLSVDSAVQSFLNRPAAVSPLPAATEAAEHTA